MNNIKFTSVLAPAVVRRVVSDDHFVDHARASELSRVCELLEAVHGARVDAAFVKANMAVQAAVKVAEETLTFTRVVCGPLAAKVGAR
jgi:hypothetical protein